MKLNHLTDQALLESAKQLAQTERETLTKILHHLREIERRRLYCDAGCASLFEYAVKCLHYSEGQAGRRIQAMRLIKEIPEIEQKIQSGALSLSNISQAQSFFRDAATGTPGGGPKIITRETKLRVLERLENKTSRDGQRELIQLGGESALPKERERVLTDDKSEIKFVMDRALREKLDEVRSLLGPDAVSMSFAELIGKIADIGAETLKAKKFGKRRAEAMNEQTNDKAADDVKSPADSTPASQSDHMSVCASTDVATGHIIFQIEFPFDEFDSRRGYGWLFTSVIRKRIRLSTRLLLGTGRESNEIMQHLM
jgi:hypothetical protein